MRLGSVSDFGTGSGWVDFETGVRVGFRCWSQVLGRESRSGLGFRTIIRVKFRD